METLYLLGSMLYLLELYSGVLLPQLKEGEEEGVGGRVSASQLKEKLVDTLLRAGRKEPLRQSRCVCVLEVYGFLVLYSSLSAWVRLLYCWGAVSFQLL